MPLSECHSISLSQCVRWNIMPADDNLAARLVLATLLSFTAAWSVLSVSFLYARNTPIPRIRSSPTGMPQNSSKATAVSYTRHDMTLIDSLMDGSTIRAVFQSPKLGGLWYAETKM